MCRTGDTLKFNLPPQFGRPWLNCKLRGGEFTHGTINYKLWVGQFVLLVLNFKLPPPLHVHGGGGYKVTFVYVGCMWVAQKMGHLC